MWKNINSYLHPHMWHIHAYNIVAVFFISVCARFPYQFLICRRFHPTRPYTYLFNKELIIKLSFVLYTAFSIFYIFMFSFFDNSNEAEIYLWLTCCILIYLNHCVFISLPPCSLFHTLLRFYVMCIQPVLQFVIFRNGPFFI